MQPGRWSKDHLAWDRHSFRTTTNCMQTNERAPLVHRTRPSIKQDKKSVSFTSRYCDESSSKKDHFSRSCGHVCVRELWKILKKASGQLQTFRTGSVLGARVTWHPVSDRGAAVWRDLRLLRLHCSMAHAAGWPRAQCEALPPCSHLLEVSSGASTIEVPNSCRLCGWFPLNRWKRCREQSLSHLIPSTCGTGTVSQCVSVSVCQCVSQCVCVCVSVCLCAGLGPTFETAIKAVSLTLLHTLSALHSSDCCCKWRARSEYTHEARESAPPSMLAGPRAVRVLTSPSCAQIASAGKNGFLVKGMFGCLHSWTMTMWTVKGGVLQAIPIDSRPLSRTCRSRSWRSHVQGGDPRMPSSES